MFAFSIQLAHPPPTNNGTLEVPTHLGRWQVMQAITIAHIPNGLRELVLAEALFSGPVMT